VYGGLWKGDEHGRAIWDGGSTSLPSFRSRNGGETLRSAIIHYMATSARLQWCGWLFRYAIGRKSKLLSCASRASPRRACKGAWRGLHGGTGADTTLSPRLSPMRVLQGNPPWAYLWIRHKRLRPVPPWSLQQLGRPVGNPPYHPDRPPWLAGLGLHRWYTRLVYPQ
jgi:hypothetical protein